MLDYFIMFRDYYYTSFFKPFFDVPVRLGSPFQQRIH
jgi:hypothetical protein